jgi:hypothetical protein
MGNHMKDGKLKFKEKFKGSIERTKDRLGCVLGLGAFYLGLTIAVNAVAFPFAIGFNGLERLIGADKKQTTAILVDKGYTDLHSWGRIYWGIFEKENGEKTTLYDNFDILSGKFSVNTKLPKAEVGESYELTSLEGPMSNKVIDLD